MPSSSESSVTDVSLALGHGPRSRCRVAGFKSRLCPEMVPLEEGVGFIAWGAQRAHPARAQHGVLAGKRQGLAQVTRLRGSLSHPHVLAAHPMCQVRSGP